MASKRDLSTPVRPPSKKAGGNAVKSARRTNRHWKNKDKAVIRTVDAVQESFKGWYITEEVRKELIMKSRLFTMSLAVDRHQVEGRGVLMLTVTADDDDKRLATYNYATNAERIDASPAYPEWEDAVSIARHVSQFDAERYEAYIDFKDEVELWVLDFNAEWGEQTPRLEATHEWVNEYRTTAEHTEEGTEYSGDLDPSNFGTHIVRISVVHPERDDVLVYKFQIDYFGHTVEDKLFFYKTGAETRNTAKKLVKEKYEHRDGKTRTLLGMLSEWNCEFCNLGTEHMSWIKRRNGHSSVPGRAVLVDDRWTSADGTMTSETLKSALDTYTFLEGKATRHGRYPSKALREHISKNGYYALMAAGSNLEGVGDPDLLALRPMVLTDICI